ncbi:MAG: hypothetical protein ACLQVL_21175 [Terriglobia bacterium]
MSEEDKQLPRPTLTQFIDKNHNLISTLAIFATLSVFANSLTDKGVGTVGNLLSFVLFSLAILVGIEIVGNFAPIQDGKLGWFQHVFLATIGFFAWVWVRTYYPYLVFFLIMTVGLAILLLIFAMFSMIIRRTVPRISWLKNKSQRTREVLLPTFGGMLLMMLFIVISTHIRSILPLWQFFSNGK